MELEISQIGGNRYCCKNNLLHFFSARGSLYRWLAETATSWYFYDRIIQINNIIGMETRNENCPESSVNKKWT